MVTIQQSFLVVKNTVPVVINHIPAVIITAVVDWLIERASSMFSEIDQKPCIKVRKVIDRGKGSKALTEVKPVKNISKNL